MEKQGIAKIEEWRHLGKADVHIHSNFSDARPSVEEILEYVETKTDLDVIAISDHDTTEGAFLAKELMAKKKYRFELIIGEEVSSQEGHILALFLKKTIPKNLPAHEVLAEIKNQDGLAIAAHPFERTRMNNTKMVMMDGIGAITLIKEQKNFDAVEVVNATPTLSDENLRASVLNTTLLGKAETGSSDAHILEAISKGYTLFEGKTAAEFKEAILTRQTRAMFKKWTLLALIKYFFFFIPLGWRMVVNTVLHGRRPKRKDLI